MRIGTKTSETAEGWRTLAVRLVLCLAFGLAGCGDSGLDADFEARSLSLNHAAKDLLDVGLDTQALALWEARFHLDPSVEEAERLAAIYEAGEDSGAAGDCLERLYPSSRSEALRKEILRCYLEGWQWKKARPYIDDEGGAALRRVEDILSRSKSIREPFSSLFHLHWETEGCLSRPMAGCLLLSSEVNRGLSTAGPVFHTPLGWNGEDCKLVTDVQLVRLDAGTRLVWGIASHPRDEEAIYDARNQSLLLEFTEGRLALHCRCPGMGAPLTVVHEGYLPERTWLRFTLEYVGGGMEEMIPAGAAGKVRAMIRHRASERAVMRLETECAIPFAEGRIMAGFFNPDARRARHAGFALCVDEFAFDN